MAAEVGLRMAQRPRCEVKLRRVALERLGAAALGLLALTAPSGLRAERSSAVPAHPDDKTIVHVLNRAAFGPRPGDVARVRQMGLSAWIESQLRPDRIPDGAVQARLAGYTTLTLTSREIAQDYFLPMVEARREAKKSAGEASSETAPAGRSPAPPERSEGPAGERSEPAPAAEPGEAAQRPSEARARNARDALGHRRAHRAEDRPGRLQRPAARRSPDRFLVQPLQRLRRQGTDADLSHRVRARGDPPARAESFPRAARGDREEPRDALLSRQRAQRGPVVREVRREPARICRSSRYARGRRPQGHEGDARPDRQGPQEHPDRHQRELRPRADGAAHARRRRRLHAAGCRQRRARADGLDDRRPEASRRRPVRVQPAHARPRREGRARPSHQGRRRHRRRRAGARHPGVASLDGEVHRDGARAPVRRRPAAGVRSSSARPRRSAAPTATSAR